MRDVNRCHIYLQAFYTSDIMDLAGKSIEDWAKKGKGQANRASKWNWTVQQGPLATTWKNWQLTLQGIASEDGNLYQHLGSWVAIKNMHQYTEWNLDSSALALYRHNKGIWTTHRAINYGHLRFESTGVIMAETCHVTHKADGIQRRLQIELSEIHRVQPHESEGGNDPADSIYTSKIGEIFHALLGNIPEIALPENVDCTKPTDLIVAT
jgi:hypothetical protein